MLDVSSKAKTSHFLKLYKVILGHLNISIFYKTFNISLKCIFYFEFQVFNKHMDVNTHQLKGKEKDEEDSTGKHGEAQQEHQWLILTDAREFTVQCLIFQLLVI